MTRQKAVAALHEHRKAVAGELAQVDAAIAALNGKTHSATHTVSGPRRLSTEARLRIAAAQRKRWAKVKAAKKKGATKS
jgi:hypothetical protein